MTPRATYRLQFHKEFTFDDAAALAPYLAELGVSHVYASPFFKAHPGSTHGYDIVDYTALNPELGGQPAFDRMVQAFTSHGLRQIVDFVPNHMGVGGSDNALWLDLLEWGEEADHAGWFDVDWSPDRTDIRNKVLVPLLGAQYGEVLERGELVLQFDPEEGSFAIWAHGAHKLPICPVDYEAVLGATHPALVDLGDGFADVKRWRPQIMRRTRDLKAELARLAGTDASTRAAIDARVAALNGRPGDLASWSGVAALIERQNWKPAHHLVASDDINYRRFFNIATLAGIRMELPDVFDQAHARVFDMMRAGIVDGLRIDHIDGLFDPKAYLRRLRSEGPHTPDGEPPYLVVEKILEPDEALRPDWPVDGTTGYDFTNLLTGVFVQAEARETFTRLYRSFTGETRSFEQVVHASKLQIIDDEMSSELHRLARAATRVARQNPRTADFTLTVIQRALRLIVAAFPVYRTYVDGEGQLSREERTQLDTAVASARRADPAVDPTVFVFLRALLSGELVDRPESGYRRSDVFRCAMKVQQYCGPVMAKGVEDTAFYRYNRFVVLNEVGGAPDRFGVSVAQFHAANAERARHWPHAMLATSTHDTKRGEDTRARLAALSTVAEDWERNVRTWNEILQLSSGTPASPDRNDRYLLYQLLAGTWPVELIGEARITAEIRDAYVERLQKAMVKSMREAKVHSTWTTPDDAYERSMAALIEAALRGPEAPRFLEAFRPFASRIAELGAHNTFAQTVLKLTVPGMPDIYQGTELWDLTMVDPDNRRAIDYASRTGGLARVADPSSTIPALWSHWQDGAFKQALTTRLLQLRAREPGLFSDGAYEAIDVAGPTSDAVCAFARHTPQSSLVVLAKRFPAQPIGADGVLTLPEPCRGRTGTALFSQGAITGEQRCGIGTLLPLPAEVWLFSAA